MILETGSRSDLHLNMSVAEAFKLQAALTEALRRHLATNGMLSGETVDTGFTVVRNGQLIPSSLTVSVGDTNTGR